MMDCEKFVRTVAGLSYTEIMRCACGVEYEEPALELTGDEKCEQCGELLEQSAEMVEVSIEDALDTLNRLIADARLLVEATSQ